jgi:hypothetical protein
MRWLLPSLALGWLSACHHAPTSDSSGGAAGIAANNAAATPGLTPADIDRQLEAAWAEKKITPAPTVDDARFLRRASLDLTGTLPTPEVVQAFLADHSPNKRAKAVDALLGSAAYADHWTNYWDEELLGPRIQGQLVDRGAFRRWLHARFAANTPWNQLVFDLISARGQNSLGGQDARQLSADSATDAALVKDEKEASVNGAVNWLLKYQQNPQDLAGSTSRIFLGVQIQCAQCHDHKTEKWKQTDFQSFAASFVRTKIARIDEGKEIKGVRRVELRDEDHVVFGKGKKAKANMPELAAIAAQRPTALDGTNLDLTDSPRRALAGWMVSPQNPWFATALVNRLWSKLLGRGFVEPMDDLRPSNPAVLPGLLRQLSDDFATHGYDTKRLLRTIVLTEAYQRATAPHKDIDDDLWAHARLRPLGPEELINALFEATQLEPALQEAGASDSLEEVRARLRRDFTFLFDVDEEGDDDTFNGTIPQALLLLNGSLINRSVRPIPGTTIAQVLAMPGGDDLKVQALYLRTLSRMPTPEETAKWVTYISSGDLEAENAKKPGKANGGDLFKQLGNKPLRDRSPKVQAYEDLFWALLNSSEFVFNH